MAHLKSLGLDDFNPSFNQKCWHIVSEEVTSIALKFLNKGVFNKCINYTYIFLIPKICCPVNVSDFRPISLYNVIYKLVSKVLVNRLKQVLHEIISTTQSAFMPGRLITDNIIVAYEVLHSMKTRQRGKKGTMAIKLDILKAYDKLEWSSLEEIMRKLGFTETWISRIMSCITTFSYSTLINDQPGIIFTPSRGLR